jgi:hypothetical protein
MLFKRVINLVNICPGGILAVSYCYFITVQSVSNCDYKYRYSSIYATVMFQKNVTESEVALIEHISP